MNNDMIKNEREALGPLHDKKRGGGGRRCEGGRGGGCKKRGVIERFHQVGSFL